MRIKEYLNTSEVAAEIEALYQTIEEQQKTINDLVIVVNSLVKQNKLDASA